MAAFLALISGLMWGTGDFFGGFVSRKVRPVKVLILSYPIGLFFLVIMAFMLPGNITRDSIVYGSIAGVIGILAIGSLYIALAIGPMGVMSPVSAATSTVIPIIIGIFIGEKINSLGWLGIFLAIIAVIMVSFERGEGKAKLSVSLKGLVIAISSGMFIGMFLSIVGLSSSESGIWTLVFARIVSTLIAFSYFFITKNEDFKSTYKSNLIALILISGALDATANALFVIATQSGYLTVTAVIASLFPAATVVLAAAFLKERLRVMQILGVVLALLASAILSTI